MPVTEPGPERWRLGFAAAAQESFGFLETVYGLRLVSSESTYVRYEGERRFVNVFHGRASYELGVEVGRWLEVDDEVVEQRFSLRDVVALSRDPEGAGFRAFSATEAGSVRRFVPQLAAWTREFGDAAIAGGDEAFERMSIHAARESQTYLQEGRASLLRRRAESAWHERDFADVVLAYREILDELPLVQLRPSELGRLHYAEGKLDEPI